MNLNELKSMIAKEYKSYMAEQAAATPSVDVDTGDVDADGATEGDDSEDILRNIYNMLKDKFEAEDDMGDADDMGEDMVGEEDLEEDVMGEVKDDEDKNEAADMEEFVQPSSTKSHGKDAGYTPAKTTKGDGKLHEGVKRFQKLANIIK